MEPQDLKSPKSYAEQIEILRSRGCEISDEQECQRLLAHINYYRLSGYFLPFKQADDSYTPGVTSTKIFRIYEFDKKMRRLIFHALEDTEVNFRTRIAYFHAHRYGSGGYLNANSFNKRHKHQRFIDNIEREKEINKERPFVRHHIEKYSGTLPIWAAVELFSFGMLSKFYADMPVEDQKHIALEIFGPVNRPIHTWLESWLLCCANLRNVCAHYGQLYYQKFSALPLVPKDFNMQDHSKRRLFGAVFALKKVYPEKDKWDKEFLPQMAALIKEHKDYIELSHIGFTPNWKQELSN